MERSFQKNGLINLLALLVVGIAGFAVARYANTLAGHVCVILIGLGFLVAAVSWFQMRLEDRERLEKLEFDELAKSRGESALFEAKEAELFPAQRSREQFERFFIPIFTALLCLAQGTAAVLVWRWLAQSTSTLNQVKQPTVALLFAVFALVLFLLGKFSATIARIEDQRLLRPGAGYLLLGAYISFLVTVGIIGVVLGFGKSDLVVARILCALLGLIAVETLIQLVLEIYRPRVKGKIERPLYESRLVGLLGQPEGLITTAAQALDYQFGFKVSETGFYRFFERWLGWLLLAQLGLLLLSSCIVFIESGEQGVREHLGKVVEGRGLPDPWENFKWPWPIVKVYRYPTGTIQGFEIGTAPDAVREEAKTVLWTVAHNKEDNFLVANRVAVTAESAGQTKRTPPVSLLTGTIPIQFQITNLTAWAYNNEDSLSLLQDLATREVVRYLVGADMSEIMSHGRLEASRTLQARIQAAADQRQLGARIINAGLQDLHPPVKVAPDYEKVVAATHTRQAKILAAKADDIRTNALAGAQATSTINKAEAERQARQISALAQEALFRNQLPAFEAAPSVYAQRAYLQTLVRSTASARKYLVLTTNTQNTIQFDLQDKISEPLLGMKLPAPKK